ncbi:hypothetical protein BAL199_22092 [alpha proteobacterium BAL199]|jgi:hypothetical protein|nr:hypothetical protein BAL199_22092 [alpha proteobacterium BAL199]
MAIDGIGSTLSNTSVAGVRAANEQVRTLGAGISQLIQGTQQIAEGAQASSTATPTTPAPSVDPSRGQTVDIFA